MLSLKLSPLKTTNSFINKYLKISKYFFKKILKKISLLKKQLLIWQRENINHIIMNNRMYILFVVLFFLTQGKLLSQTISYAYDKSGNRVLRSIVIEAKPSLKKLSIDEPAEPNKEQPSQSNNAAVPAPEIINDALGNMPFQIYPNPVNEMLYIETPPSNNNASMTLSLSDATGKIHFIAPLQRGINSIPFEKLSKGMYYIHIGDEKENLIYNIIKQ